MGWARGAVVHLLLFLLIHTGRISFEGRRRRQVLDNPHSHARRQGGRRHHRATAGLCGWPVAAEHGSRCVCCQWALRPGSSSTWEQHHHPVPTGWCGGMRHPTASSDGAPPTAAGLSPSVAFLSAPAPAPTSPPQSKPQIKGLASGAASLQRLAAAVVNLQQTVVLPSPNDVGSFCRVGTGDCISHRGMRCCLAPAGWPACRCPLTSQHSL